MDLKDDKFETYAVANGVDQRPMDELDPTGVLVKPKWRGTYYEVCPGGRICHLYLSLPT